MRWLKAVAIAVAILVGVGTAGAGAVLASDPLAKDVRAISNDMMEVWAETALDVTHALREE
jgi:hypothetical protein